MKWLYDEALRRGDQCKIGEVAYAFPYALVTQPIMKKLQEAVVLADTNFPREIWECIKLANLDLYAKPAIKGQRARSLITSERSLIHDYRRSYDGNLTKGTAGNNADGDKPRKLKDTHPRRFVLSAETQIGKTGAYTWFLKLLQDEIHGETIPRIPKGGSSRKR